MKENEGWRNTGPLTVVLAVLALLGFRSFNSESTNPSGEQVAVPQDHSVQQERDEQKGKANGGQDGKRFWQPLRDFRAARAPDRIGKEIAGLSKELTDIDGWEMHYLIACVPDPIDSTSGHRFDGLIDAIQRAAETQGYTLDRYYYPWPKKKGVEVTTDETLTGDNQGSGRVYLHGQSTSRKREASDSAGEPGLLLLRRHNPCRLLLVFLVGETATAGLDKEAFASSLEFIKKLKMYRDKRVIPVLGPHFSGSQTSLQLAIQAFASQQTLELLGPISANPLQRAIQVVANRERSKLTPTFRIISGNASSIHKEELDGCCRPLARVCFQATVVPGEAIVSALYEYLNLGRPEGNGYCFRDKFAILCESNTGFGQAIKQNTTGEKRGETDCKYGPTIFPFPLHISEVRGAYNQLAGPTRGNAIRLPSFGSKLELPKRSSSQPRAVEPSLDPAMTAVTSERLLARMLETMSHERFRYVFIVATEIQDSLFLATLVREHCPESRLVFFESDQLFTHPDYSSALRGSIVGSSYPLYSRNQRWSFSFEGDTRRLFLPGSGEQGYYNAAIFLLNDHDDHQYLVEYGPPFPQEYGSSSDVDVHRPPVWISIIGVGDLYPVAVTPARMVQEGQNKGPYNYQDYVYRAEANAEEKSEYNISRPGLFIVPLLGMTWLLFYVTGSYLAVLARWRQWQSRSGPHSGTQLQKLLWPRSGRLRWRQKLYAAVYFTSVLIVYGYLVFVWLVALWHGWWVEGSPVHGTPWQWIAPLVLIVVAGVTVAIWAVHSPGLRWQQTVYAVILTVVLVLYGCLVLYWQKSMGEWSREHGSPVHVAGWQWITPVVLLCVAGFFILALTARLLLGGVSLFREGANALRFLRQIFGEPLVLWIAAALLIPLVYYLTVNGGWPQGWHPGQTLLFADRAAALASGVSPVFPILCIGLAFTAWSYAHLKRLYLLDHHAANNPCPEEDEPSAQIALWHEELTTDVLRPRQALALNRGTFLFWLIWLLLFFAFSRLSIHFVPAVEGVVTETPILLSLTVLSTLIVYGWVHVWKIWGSLRQLLGALALLPLRTAYRRIPTAITNQLGPYLFRFGPALFSTPPQYRHLLDYRQNQCGILLAEYPAIADSLTTAANLPDRLRIDRPEPLREPGNLLKSTSQTCLALLLHIHRHPNLSEQLLEKPTEEKSDRPCPPPREPNHTLNIRKTHSQTQGPGATLEILEIIRPETSVDSALRHWLARAEDFVALEIAVYVSRFFAQLRNLILCLSVVPVLFLLAVTSYPFQPQRLWMLLGVTLIGLVTSSVLWIIFQIERNEMVSRIVQTTPNQLNFHWTFLSHILVYAVPLLGILVAMSSDASDLVHSWIDPLLQWMK